MRETLASLISFISSPRNDYQRLLDSSTIARHCTALIDTHATILRSDTQLFNKIQTPKDHKQYY